jgi:hypothetical protein
LLNQNLKLKCAYTNGFYTIFRRYFRLQLKLVVATTTIWGPR